MKEKSTVSYRLIKNQFKEYFQTISLGFVGYKFKVNDEIAQIKLWDASGNDDFAVNITNLFKNTFIQIFVYEIDQKNHLKLLKNVIIF